MSLMPEEAETFSHLIYMRCIQGQATQQDDKDVVRLCRQKIRRAKAQQELKSGYCCKI